MDGGIPTLNCLLQHALRGLCTTTGSSESSSSSKWVYSVFWRILPRNYPPPKWDHGGSILDRVNGNKRNRLVGKVASDNSHKWVFRDYQNEKDPGFIPSWNVSIDPQPRVWEAQFNSGIQTIAAIAVREGIIQLGSFHKAAEDLNLVISIQRKFSYLQSIPGIYAIQRPYLTIQHPNTFRTNTPHLMIESSETAYGVDDKRQLVGSKRLYCDGSDNFPVKSINLGYNNPHSGITGPPPALWSIASLSPSTTCNPGAMYSKIPSIALPSYNAIEASETTLPSKQNSTKKILSHCAEVHKCSGLSEIVSDDVKVKASCALEAAQEGKPGSLGHILRVDCRVMERGFGHQSEEGNALN